MASNFTSIAINTSFARRYGTLKYLAITPVGKTGIWVAQFVVGCLTLIVQVPLLVAGSIILDFKVSPSPSSLITVPLLIGFSSSLAFLFSSVMSAEKVLAFANVFFIGVAGTGLYLAESAYAYLHPLAGILTTGTPQIINIALLTTATLVIIGINFKKFEWID
jgi:ABC-2 type transport system permease protein